MNDEFEEKEVEGEIAYATESIRDKHSNWDDTGYKKIREWRKRSKALLDEILDVLESKENLGFYDSLMDVGTDAMLINMAYYKYLTNSNRKHGIKDKPEYLYQPDEIRKQNKGGYDTKEFARIIEILTGANEK